MASGRLAEYHVQGSTIPNMHYQSALQLGLHEWRYTHAGTHKYFIHETAALLTKTPKLTLMYINTLHKDQNPDRTSNTAQTFLPFDLFPVLLR